MAFESFTFGKKFLPFSITNPDVEQANAVDSGAPFGFFDFLKNTSEQVSPLEYNTQYQNYLQAWYRVKGELGVNVIDEVRSRYVELLKDIAINFTTLDEKRFLLNIDYDSSTDLNIVIPFYSKKIAEICDFYRSKRDQVKYSIEKSKVKGTAYNAANSIVDDILKNLSLGNSTQVSIVSSVQSTISVDFEELYDYYSNYFDIDPSLTAADYDRSSDFFTANVNDIEANLFINFNDQLKAALFGNNTFLTELGTLFTINYNLDSVNLDCKKGDKLYSVVTNNKQEATTQLELKKKLITKYMGTDFYYLSTNSTTSEVVSGLLFNADVPQANLLNRHFPSTASVESLTKLKTLREIGTLFTPEKTGVLYFSSNSKAFTIDTTKVEADKVYIFPDPNKYGKTTGLTDVVSDYPIIFVIDNSKLSNNQSMFYAEGDLFVSPYTQSFYSYFSKNQLNNNIQTGLSSLHNDFSWINGAGIVSQWKTDIYGNQYAIFTAKNKDIINVSTSNSSKCITIDGYKFYDNIQQYNYVYDETTKTVDSVTTPELSYYQYSIVTSNTNVVSNQLNISDATYNELSGTLMLVSNTPTSAYEIDLNGNVLRNIALSGFTDTEAIVWLSAGMYAIAEENMGALSSRIVVVDVAPNATAVNIQNARVFNTHIVAGNFGVESITYNSQSKLIYYTTEKPYNNAWHIYTLNPSTSALGTLCNITALSTLYGITDIASLYYNNSAQKLFVLSQEQKCVIQIDTNGNYIDKISVAGTQPEGLAFTPNLSSMFIVGEPSEYYKYNASVYATSIASFTLTGTPTTLYFREFAPYETCSSTNNTCVFYDAATFTFSNNTPLPQQYSADSELWPGASSLYYYSKLVESGIGKEIPLSRALSGNGTLSASFTYNYTTSAVNYNEVDCGYFTDTCVLSNDYSYSFKSKYFVNEVNANAQTTFSQVTSNNAYNNVLFVKDATTGTVYPLSSALLNTFDKYSSAVKNELYSSVDDISVYYDRLFIATNSYFVIDKVKYDNGVFIKPQTPNIVYQINQDNYNRLGKPFFFENKDHCVFAILSATNTQSNSASIVPFIYKYDFTQEKVTKLYPTAFESVSAQYVNNIDVRVVNVGAPQLCYNSYNNIFAITYTTHDANNFAYLNQVKFTWNDAIDVVSIKQYAPKNIVTTMNLVDHASTHYNILTSGSVGTVGINNGAFVLK